MAAFNSHRVDHYPYSDPWRIPQEERLAKLVHGDRRIAYYYEKPDTSTFRYRIYNMMQAVNSDSNPFEISATYFCESDAPRMGEFLERASVLVVCRTKYSDITGAVLGHARRMGIPVLFDVDDLVFDDRYVQLVGESLDQAMDSHDAWDYWFAYISRIGATLRMCDAAITTNESLADRMRGLRGHSCASGSISSMRSSFGFQRRFVRLVVRTAAILERVTVGYFGGTPTHNRDFNVLAESLSEVMIENPAVRLMVVGFPPNGGLLNRLRHRVETYPLVDFVNLQEVLSMADINLVPLQDNLFTNCKSELKYFEAAVVGTPTLASPTHTYKLAMTHGENGVLVKAQDWRVRLEEAVSDPDRMATIASRACECALARYSPQQQIEQNWNATSTP